MKNNKVWFNTGAGRGLGVPLNVADGRCAARWAWGSGEDDDLVTFSDEQCGERGSEEARAAGDDDLGMFLSLGHSIEL